MPGQEERALSKIPAGKLPTQDFHSCSVNSLYPSPDKDEFEVMLSPLEAATRVGAAQAPRSACRVHLCTFFSVMA